MSDLIRREEAIEWVKNILATHLYYHPHSKSKNVPIDEVIDRLERVPSIDAVPRWIPVENGLPKEGQRVLVTIQWINGNRTVYDTNRYDVTCWRGLGRDVNIIAWMPLPKPYERKES